MPENRDYLVCSSCKGKRVIVITTGWRESKEITCYTCKGFGQITREHSDRIIKGEVIRSDRISRGLSLRQEAQRLGMKPIELARLERGE